MAALFILCDAYRYGSTMEIRFTKNVEDGWVPLTLIAMADALEIELENIGEGIITPKESRMLFIALTGFSVEATNKINEITINGLVSPEHICCLIHSNSYSLEKIEEILLTEENPGLILKDLKCQPSDYLKFNI
jgi:hypothetical protein